MLEQLGKGAFPQELGMVFNNYLRGWQDEDKDVYYQISKGGYAVYRKGAFQTIFPEARARMENGILIKEVWDCGQWVVVNEH